VGRRLITTSLVVGLGCSSQPDSEPPVRSPEPTTDVPTASPPTTTATDPPPGGNVLLLVADDVGIDKLASYAITAAPVRTPNIDALAAQGIQFQNAWALPYCGPTRAALQTGRHARRTGIGMNEAVSNGHVELDLAQTTLAELVASSPTFDYQSAFVGKWHLSTFESASGAAHAVLQGWGSFRGTFGNLGVWVGEGDLPEGAGYYLWQKVDASGAIEEKTAYATTDLVDDAIEQLATLPEPWLLEVGFHAAHGPYDRPPDELVSDPDSDGFSARKKERLILEALDTELGRLLATIPDDVRARTTIVFVSDNGTPELVVEDEVDPDRAKGSVYEPGVRVPLIVQGPLVAVPGSTSAAFVHVVDVFPTVAEIAGVDLSTLQGVLDPTSPLALDGESLLPLLADPTASARREVLYTERFDPQGPGPYTEHLQAVRDGSYKLVHDAIFDLDQFFAFGPDGFDEGPDLLPCELTPEHEAAYLRLRVALDAFTDDLVFDAEWAGMGMPDPQVVSPLLNDISCADMAD
jgi:arylsulfatase A-like enzyme